MSVVKRSVKPNRLAGFVHTPDGLTLAEAVNRAEAALEEIKPPAIERIDEILVELGVRAPPAPSSDERDALYRLANELAGTAGVFDLQSLGRAAWSLCELLDVLKGAGGWNPPAVTVHLEGLRLLRGADGAALPPQAATAVLSGLEKVVARAAEGR